jgi:hypothetical protein
MRRKKAARGRAPGQALVLVAVMLPVLMAFVLLVVEVAERWMQVATLEDALQQATRSAVQTMDYAAFARNATGLRATTACAQVRRADAAAAACRAVIDQASAYFRANLRGVRGLAEDPEALADRVTWTVLPTGGTCSYSSTQVRPVTEATPLLCAEVRPVMQGIVGWGRFTPLIVAGETLEPIR